MLVAAPAIEFFCLFDAARRPDAFAAWPPGNWQPVALAHAPDPVWEQVLLPRWLRDRRVDLLHRPSGAGGLALRPLAGSRVVVTVHDMIPWIYPAEYFRNLAHRGYFAFLMRLSRRADAVITVSEASRRDLVRLGKIDEHKIDVIPGAVDRDFLKEGSAANPESPAATREASRREPSAQPYVLAIGSGEPRKNVAAVIEAFVSIGQRIPHHLVLVGAPWRGRNVTWPAQGADRVRSLGAVSNDELRRLYAGAAVFVYPSLYEGFGLPVLEAMASGAPVITSREGSLPEVAGDAAVFVNPRDPGSIATGMLDVVNDPNRRVALVAAGREQVRRFSWAEAARKTIEVYERVNAGTAAAR